jgi:DNA-binding transcriptional LysR family regulator
MDRIAAMTTFVKVVEAGSMSAAARALELSLPAVSRQIDNLEAHLRSQLLVRTTRHMALTEGGRAYYGRAKCILAEIEDAEIALTTRHTVPSGRLTVSTPVSFGRLLLAPTLPEFLARFPEVAVDLLFLDRAVNPVEEGIDVAIHVGVLEDSSLIARKLAEYRRIVCGAPVYLKRRGEPRTLEELKFHDCLISTLLDSTQTWRFCTPEGEIQIPVSGGMRANNGGAVVAAAIGGAGLVMAPSWLVRDDLAAGRLVALPEPFQTPPTAVHALFPHARLISAKVRVFVEYLVNSLTRDLNDADPGVGIRVT